MNADLKKGVTDSVREGTASPALASFEPSGWWRQAEDWAGSVLWPLADHLGTLRDLAAYDPYGVPGQETSVASHRTFDSFGNLVDETNPAVDILFAFTGRDRDEETGLQYHRARYYDPTLGRWLSEDPIGFAARDANLRRYVHNDPIAFRDPSGLDESHYEGYWNEVGATAKGYFWNGPANLVGGLYNALRHPIQTAQGIGFAFRHPIITGQHLYNDLVDKLQTSEGQGEVAFDIALTVCTLGGTAGANAAGKTGKVVNLVDDAARSADKATDAARPAGNGSKTRTPAGPRPSYPVPRTPAKAAESPGPGWEWRGQQPVGGEKGAWFRPATGETLHPDLGHSAPVGPHWDWRAPDGTFWRLFPDGRVEPRP